MPSCISNKCDCKIEIVGTQKNNDSYIYIDGLSLEICLKIRHALDNGCMISFFGDYDGFLDISIDKEDK